MVLRPSPGSTEILFIERSRYDKDPWSGQMAFPGGMVEHFDADPRKAAERETVEEVGIELADARFLGRLDDQQGRHRGHAAGIVVGGYVYAVDAGVSARPNVEVEDVVWTPVDRFLDPRNYTHIVHPVYPGERFPGVRVSAREHQVVWGLTRRFMASFFSAIQVVFEG
jgi:8-oxo-dGTP pyrophosphatase MutT (NUDIX family)